MLTIGVFDGVHRGHEHLFGQLKARARQAGRLSGAITFRNHPGSVLQPDFKPSYLSGVDERLQLIKALAVDFVVPVTFDRGLSRLRADQFVSLLYEQLHMRGLVMGPDFTMGHQREGDAQRLTELGSEMGFTVTVVEPLVDEDGSPIRSTTIRQALGQGDVTRVAALMGRNFSLVGKVVRGSGRGGPLGFPTANLSVSNDRVVPGDGIYATWAYLGSGRFMAATSLGVRPTFDESQRTIEAFIMDFDEDVYDLDIRLEFVTRLRDELKFDSVEALREQMAVDVDNAREVLWPLKAGSA